MAVEIGKIFKISETNSIEDAPGYGSIGEFLTTTIIPNILVAANLILFAMIVFSGFTIIANAGNADKQKQASQTLTWAVIGFLIVFGGYWLMQVLGIITGVEILGGLQG